MPRLRPQVRSGDRAGGILSYPLDELFEEVAFIAYYFHWPMVDILNLEHEDRERFIQEISDINRKSNQGQGSEPSAGIPLELWPG